MDKEIVRKQIFDELHAQFESKLRDAKRQKAHVESELESAGERWRAERRRLNSEIDRLESSLSEARENRKRTGAKNGGGMDPAEVAKIQAAAEAKIQQAAQDFEVERAELRKEIARLEHTLADLLERSNNPLRSATPIKEQLEAQLAEAARAKQHAEEELRRAQIAWEEEKKKLSSAPGKAARDMEKARGDWEAEQTKLGSEVSRLREESAAHKRQVDELRREQVAWQEENKKLSAAPSKAARDMEKARGDWEAEQKKLEGEISRLREESAAHKRQAQEAAKKATAGESSSTAIGEQLRDAMQHKNFLEQKLDAANETIQKMRASHAEEIAALEKQISLLENNLKQAQSEGVRDDVADQLRKQYDERLEEIVREKTHLAEELKRVNATLESERKRFSSAAAAAAPAASSKPANGADDKPLREEIARVEGLIADISRLIDDPTSELSTVIRKNVERAELDAYLKGILFSMGRGAGL